MRYTNRVEIYSLKSREKIFKKKIRKGCCSLSLNSSLTDEFVYTDRDGAVTVVDLAEGYLNFNLIILLSINKLKINLSELREKQSFQGEEIAERDKWYSTYYSAHPKILIRADNRKLSLFDTRVISKLQVYMKCLIHFLTIIV